MREMEPSRVEQGIGEHGVLASDNSRGWDAPLGVTL